MDITLSCQPASSVACVTLGANETLTAEVGSMVCMDPTFVVETSTQKKGGGGFFKALKRMVAGENMFLNHFTATKAGSRVWVAPGLLGDVMLHKLVSGDLIVQGSSWLASGPGITIDASWQGFGKALFSGEGMFWVRLSGQGDVLMNSFGAIYPVEVDGGYIVDTGHVVAFESTLDFKIGKASESLIGSFLGGEGLVCKFHGRGRLWCQSHNAPGFGAVLGPKLKPR